VEFHVVQVFRFLKLKRASPPPPHFPVRFA
jgi:hypothetical protein